MDILLANGFSCEHCERKLHCLTQENFTCYHYVKYVLLKLHSTLHRTVLFVIWLFVLQVKAYSFWIFPIHRCVLAPFTQYFPPESWEKNITGMLLGWGLNHDPCNSRAVSYQLDYRGCAVARRSSNPSFWQRYRNDIRDAKFASGICIHVLY